MTVTRSDQKRLGASLGVLGLLLEENGEAAWDKFQGWELGPSRAPGETPDEVCACGHSVDSHDGICLHLDLARPCWCAQFTPAPRGSAAQDRSAEGKQAARASEQLAEHRADLTELDRLVQRCLRRMDVAFPPNLSELKRRKSGELDPMTPADAAANGWCASCWRNDQQMVPREKQKGTDLYYSSSLCRWCLLVKNNYGIEPPLEILKLRHAGRRISEAVMAEAIEKAKPKPKGKKRKGKKAA